MLHNIIILGFILTLILQIYGKSMHHDEICGGFDGRRLYLELGEHGTVFATNQTAKSFENNTNETQCTLEIVTCPSCVISFQFSYLNISYSCDGDTTSKDCLCSYVSIFEPSYKDVSERTYCGRFTDNTNNTLGYRSITRIATVRFAYKVAFEQAFVLKYYSERNRNIYDGFPRVGLQSNRSFKVSSPFFPSYYPRDLSVEYIINCKSIEDCRIKLVFTDFQISRPSLMEFFDWNGQRIFVTTGSVFRPPILVSTGRTIVIRFYGNGGTNIGYTFAYSFILSGENSTNIANTNCGGLINNLGGGITMGRVVEKGVQLFDCFWIIGPPRMYLYQKTHLYIKITEFEHFGTSTELIVREGLTSTGNIVYRITRWMHPENFEYTVPINLGFYVSLRGYFNETSRLEIAYAAFSFGECTIGPDFLCQNQRCIQADLQCDGYDHCGDASDEPEICIGKARIYPHAPNFFFPHGSRDFDLKSATIVFIVSSLALISLVISLIVLILRINVRSTNSRHIHPNLRNQSINDILEEIGRVEVEEIIISDDPPDYEAPPAYTDVIKVVTKSENKRVKVLKRTSRRKHVIRHDLRDPNIENDTSSLSTVDSTSNLITQPAVVSESEQLSEMDEPHVEAPELCGACSSATGVQQMEDNGLNRLSNWIRRTHFSANEDFDIFSRQRINKSHCLSDSDLCSVTSCPQGDARKKLRRSSSTQNFFKL